MTASFTQSAFHVSSRTPVQCGGYPSAMERAEVTDRYLDALGLERAAPTLSALTEITRRHVATFPFSSVGPRLGDDLPLDLDALFDRIVARHRGGYCFEQNGLLFEVLLELGYDVHVQLARVIYNRDYLPGLTHRVTRVVLDDRTYVADVGFGPLGPPVPVPMPHPMPMRCPTQTRSCSMATHGSPVASALVSRSGQAPWSG